MSNSILTVLLVFYSLQLQRWTIAQETTSSPSNCSQSVLHRGETVSTCCVFPFIYNGEQHNRCIKSGDNVWCSTTANYDVDQKKTDCPVTHSDDGEGDEEGQCHSFPSGLSTLTGGTIDADRRWSLQCQPSHSMTSFWDDVHRFTLLGDVKCCNAPVDQNISHVFNLSMRVGGKYGPLSRWKAQCPDNYVITGLHAQKTGFKKSIAFGNLDAVKCSLLMEHRLDYSSCTTVDLPDKTGGTRNPTATWRTEWPYEHFISAVYNDKKFSGVKKIKCCPLRAVDISQQVCTFEDKGCRLWDPIEHEDGKCNIRNGTIVGTVDHTTGKSTGHMIHMTSGTSQLSSVGMTSYSQGRCLSLWYFMKGNSSIDFMALHYNKSLESLVKQNLGNIEAGKGNKWTEKQVVLPKNVNYQVIIKGVTTSGSQGEIALDDIQFKPERFCTGVCSSLGPLQGLSSIHDGSVILWRASCRYNSSSSVTSIVTGLWEKQGSHFKIVEYLKCCNMPVGNFDKLLLAGKEGGPVSEGQTWNAQCKDNHVLTGIYSLNKFNGFYQLQCSALYQSRLDYTNCVVIWGKVRNHVGDAIRQHVECPSGMAIVALFDQKGDNNSTSFADIDAIKCCNVDITNCVTRADCHSNANCVSTNTIKKCICRVGYHGNGKFCQLKIPLIPNKASPSTLSKNTTIRTIHTLTNPSTKTSIFDVGDKPSQHIRGFTTSNSLVHHQKQENKLIILVSSVIVAGLFIVVILGALGWHARRGKRAHLRVQGSTIKDEATEMTPFNEIRLITNDNRDKDQQVETDDVAITFNDCRNPDKNKSDASVSFKPRSATVLSGDHAYVSEEDLDDIPAVREPFYFELDKSLNQKTYSVNRSLALPEPMYGVLEPDTERSSEEAGAHFWKPANTEEELYLQLSCEIKRDKIEVGTERLGSGAFGHVLIGLWQKSPGIPVQVALKMLRDSTHLENKIKFLQEAAIMRQFTHKNVIYMYGIVTNSEPVMIVLEYMSRGNLKNYLRQLNSKYGDEILLQDDTRLQFLHMARDIAAGMQYLHSLAFVHRDLAARNILLDSDMTCKIGDFGMSRDLVESDYYTSRGGRIPVKWTAPEAINYGKYSSSSDVWSYGIVLFEIWSLGRKPYASLENNEVIEAMSRGYRLPPPLHCPNMLYRLMVDCWHPESQYRPRSYQIHHCLCFSHHFLDDSVCVKQRTQSDLTSARASTYLDLKYVYTVTE